MEATARIGDLLVAQDALSRPALEDMLRRARGRLGHFLHAHGAVDGRQVARAIATQHGLDAIDLKANPPEKQLYVPRDVAHYRQYRFIPYRHRGGTLTLATTEPSAALREFAQAHYRMRVVLAVITERDLAHYFTTRGATCATRRARLGLRRQHKHLTADRTLMAHQLQALILVLVSITAVGIAAPQGSWQALIVLCNCFYFATLLIKFEFYRQGVLGNKELKRQEQALRASIAALDEASLPTYSILVPMYRETRPVMKRLIRHLSKLDYPKEKLDIKLICEADDHTTLRSLMALKPPAMMQIVRVPPSRPRTKPKACNLALEHVRGEFVVIYDAEDAPAMDQLKRAVVMFRAGPPELACLQAALNYYNRDENLLTQLFSIEYSALFTLLLPGLSRMQLPIPLGGTSNHLRTATLRAVGGWDAFNVTEDADLGVRLHYFGFTTAVLPSLTLEEATVTLGAWLKQRTRWIKGYIQTWLVFTRDPRELKRRLGRTGYYGFQFFIGAPALTFLLAPLFWFVFFASFTGLFPVRLSLSMQILCMISFAGGIISHWVFARTVLKLEGWHHLTRAGLLYPFYWLLHSFAAARALWQLITAPHYWDKTKHGISRLARS